MTFEHIVPIISKDNPFVPIYPDNYPAGNMEEFLDIQGHKSTCRLHYPYFYKLQKKSTNKVALKCLWSGCGEEIIGFEVMIKHWLDAHKVRLVKHGHYCPLCEVVIQFGIQSFNKHARYDCVRTSQLRKFLERISKMKM